MKRVFILNCLSAAFFLSLPASGQDTAAMPVAQETAETNAAPVAADTASTNSAATTAAASAAKDATDEKFKQMASDIDSLRAANQALSDQVSSLKDTIQQLRDDQTRRANDTSVQDSLKLLAQKIEEVDQKRQADKQMISDDIQKFGEKMEKMIGSAAPLPRAPVTNTASATDSDAKDGFSYSIKKDETLTDILKVYNAEFKSKGWKQVSLKQAEDANPGVDWNRLKVGQRIVIPRPPE